LTGIWSITPLSQESIALVALRVKAVAAVALWKSDCFKTSKGNWIC